MKKTINRTLRIQAAAGIILCALAIKILGAQNDFVVISCVSDAVAAKTAELAGFNAAGQYGLRMEDMMMQIAYQLARRSVVKVVAKDAAGSGIIWKIEDNGIVIVSNRHLLMKDVEAEVVFYNNESVTARILGYSQQYDIGFLKIQKEVITNKILRDIYEAVPFFYPSETQSEKSTFAAQFSGIKIIQVCAVLDKKTPNFSVGTIKGLDFVPLFNTNILETECFSRAGMSGGGVFDKTGQFVGMISGGAVPDGSEKKEAEVTYSIPPVLIASEYEIVTEK